MDFLLDNRLVSQDADVVKEAVDHPSSFCRVIQTPNF